MTYSRIQIWKMWKAIVCYLAATASAQGPNRPPTPIDIDVAVVGVGLAGAEIASLAVSDGRVPTIFESRSTYGGRTQSVHIGDYTLPKGGGWQQGTGRNHALTKRIRECGIEVKGQNWNRWLDFCVNGTECGASWGDFEAAFACAEGLAVEFADYGAISMETGLRLCGWWAQSDDEFLIQDSTILFEWAENPSVLGLQYNLPWLTYAVHTDADNFFTDPRGAEEMAACWLDRYGVGREQSVQVNYNSRVTNIDSDAQILTLANGTRYHYNVLFNTMPLGVMSWNLVKEEGSLFTPALPLSKQVALHGYHVPVYQKIYFQFPTAFWNAFSPNKEFFNIAPIAPHQCTLWQNVDLSDGWLTGSRIIYLTCTSPQSNYAENLTEQQWADVLMPELRKVFGDDIPSPERVVISEWLSDPNFRGTFSNRPVESTPERLDEFFAPMGTDGTHIITGEAYCRNMNGFMHSAILAAETSWCEYQVRTGERPADTPCRAVAVDADGDELPNWCFNEGLAKRSVTEVPRRARMAHSALSDAEVNANAHARLARALDIVSD